MLIQLDQTQPELPRPNLQAPAILEYKTYH